MKSLKFKSWGGVVEGETLEFVVLVFVMLDFFLVVFCLIIFVKFIFEILYVFWGRILFVGSWLF